MSEKKEKTGKWFRKLFSEGKTVNLFKRASDIADTEIQVKNFFKILGFLIVVGIGILVLLGMGVHKIRVLTCEHKSFISETATYNFDERIVTAECKVCEKKFSFEGSVVYVVSVEPTCETGGTRLETWTINEHSELNANLTVHLKPYYHTDSTLIEERVEPTCSSVGYTALYKCNICGEYHGKEEISNEGINHDLIWIYGTEPTCTSTGISDYRCCKNCDYIDVAAKTLDMLPHSYKSTVVKETYSKTGYTYYTCIDCGYEYIDEDSYVKPLVNNVIKYRVYPNEGNSFNDGNPYIIVTGPQEGVTEVVVPEEIDGIKVLKIEGPLNYNASHSDTYFHKNEQIKKVVLPETLYSIEKNAFFGCTALEEINIPKNLKVLGEYAFGDCVSLNGELVVPGCVGIIDVRAFYNCSSIKTLIIEEGVTSIAGGAFLDCTNLTMVFLPKSTTYVEYGAFANCNNILVVRDVNDAYNRWPESVVYRVESFNDFGLLEYDKCKFIYDEINDKYLLFECNMEGATIELPIDVNGKSYEILTGGLANLMDKNVTSLTLRSMDGKKFYDLFAGEGSIPETIKELIIDTTDEFPYNYFSQMTSLEKLVLTEKSTKRSSAFAECSSLKEVVMYKEEYSSMRTFNDLFYSDDYGAPEIPESIRKVTIYDMDTMSQNYFLNCDKLEEINLPDNLRVINDNAFKNCLGLKQIVLPVGLETIGYNVFAGCKNLLEVYNLSEIEMDAEYLNQRSEDLAVKVVYTSLDQTSNFVELGDYVFLATSDNRYTLISYKGNDTTISLPETINGYSYRLDKNLFFENKNIVSVTIPSSVTKIPEKLFYGCSSLETVTIEGNCTEIPNEMFYKCTKLKNANFNGEITKIGNKAFYNCYSLENLEFNGEGVLELGEYVFYSCSKLKTLKMAEGLLKVPSYAFYCCSEINVELPSTVTEIGTYAFERCLGITSLQLPESLITIDEYAFNLCTKLVDIAFNEKLENINRYAFNECSKISSLIFNDGIKKIESYAFYKCKGVNEIYIPLTITKIQNAFNSCSGVKKLTMPVCCDAVYSIFSSSISSSMPSQILEINIIGNRAIPEGFFDSNSYTEKISLDDEITIINDGAIRNLSSLKEIKMPKNIEHIGIKNFIYTNKNVNIIFPSNAYYQSVSDNTAIIDLRTKTLICGNEYTVIPTSVVNIGDYAFYGMIVDSYSVPVGIQKIGNGAFQQCKNLSSFTFSTTVKEVGDEIFWGNTKMLELVIPKTIEKFGNAPFDKTPQRTFYYEGNEDEFALTGFSIISAYSKVYYYIEDKPENTGNYWHYVDGVITKW